MKKRLKISCSILIVALIILSSTACYGGSKKKISTYNDKIDTSLNVSSGVVASNSNYDLIWNDSSMMAILKNRSTGQIWSTIPYKYFEENGTSQNVNSGLNLTVSDTKTFQIDNVNGFSNALLNGTILTKKIKNGVKATYYFDKYQVSVPVVYTLEQDSLTISIDPTKITEGDSYKVVSVTPAPFMCSVSNSHNGSYLVVPTGSGALMYTDERADGDRKYVGDVYGIDGARLQTSNSVDEEAIRLPIYGAVDNSNALLSIIQSGAEFSSLEAVAGNSRTGYSNISSNFYVRSFDIVNSGVQSLKYEDITKISDNVTPNQIKIAYYPLANENSSYIGIANRYNKYLTDNKLINIKGSNNNLYGINFIGGVLTYSTLLGIPTKDLNVLTSFKDAKQIVEDLNNDSSMKPSVMLSGFGSTGINPGKIAGGFNFKRDFGTKKERQDLEKLCEDNKIDLYSDFDLIRFSKSGNGFTTLFDSAKSASLQAVNLSPIINPLRKFDKDNKYRILKREELEKVITKLTKATNKLSVSGVGISTLSNIAYSDYSQEKYFSKGNMSDDVIKYIKQLQKSGHNVAAVTANAYAAAMVNTVYSTPVNNGGYYAFDKSIPLYQIIFGSSTSLYSPSINNSANPDKIIMQSIASGTRLSFDLINNFDISDIKIQTKRFYGSSYEDNKNFIKQTLKKYEQFYKLINNASIKDYQIIDNNITKTVFDNGIVVYANHSGFNSNSPVGELLAYEVRWNKE